jgi:hypothetical protein
MVQRITEYNADILSPEQIEFLEHGKREAMREVAELDSPAAEAGDFEAGE